MLCSICNDEIFQGDEIKCATCKEFLHVACGGLSKVNLRKLAKLMKDKWCCSNCKTVSYNVIIDNEKLFVGSNETLASLTDSVKLMSGQFDGFSKQLLEFMNTIKELKEENKRLKESNCKLVDDSKVLSKKVNMFEQKSVRNNVEILGVPEISNENFANTVKNIAVKLDVKLSVVKTYRIHTNMLNKPK